MVKTRKVNKSSSLNIQKAGMKNCLNRTLVYKPRRIGRKIWYKMNKKKIGQRMNLTEIKFMKKKKWRLSKKKEPQRRMPSWLKSLLKDRSYLKTSGAFQKNCYYAIGDIKQLKRELDVKEKGILKKRSLIRITRPKESRKVSFNSKPVHSQKQVIKRNKLLTKFTKKHKKIVEDKKANNLKKTHANELKKLEERQRINLRRLKNSHLDNLRSIRNRGIKGIRSIIKPEPPSSPSISDEELFERIKKLRENSPPKQKLDEYGLPEVNFN